jgi:hypothetical protein
MTDTRVSLMATLLPIAILMAVLVISGLLTVGFLTH